MIYEIADGEELHRHRSGPRTRARCRISQPHLAGIAATPDRRAKAVEGRPPHHRLALTAKGRTAFADLDSRSRGVVAALLDRLDAGQRATVVNAMATIEHTLEPPAEEPASFLLRSHRPGDIGWVVSRHGALYAQEYGWDISFEALVAEIAAQFIRSTTLRASTAGSPRSAANRSARCFWSRHPTRLRNCACCWWRKRREDLASGARSPGNASISRAQAGYASITLWTQSILIAARGIYQHAGFRRVSEEKHRSFGVDLVGETWELKL